MARCGRCRVVTVPDHQAWCADCNENDNPNNYVGGVHISRVELPDPWEPVSRVAPEGTPVGMVLGCEADRSAAQWMLDVATDSLAEDCYTNNPPELAVLEGVFFDYPMGEHATPILFGALNDAVKGGLVVADLDATSLGWRLTEAGEKRLADLWGSERVPPGKGGHVSCWDHGVYVVAPGDSWACPDCPDTRTDDEVLRDLAEDPVIGGAMTLADADAVAVADRMIRQFEAQQARRRKLRLAVRYVGIRLVVAAVAVLVWLFADAII